MRPINVGALVGVVVSSAIYAIFGWMLLAQFTHWFRSYWIFGAPSLRSLRRMLEIDAARSMNLVPAKRPPMRRLAFNFLRLGLIVFALYLVFGGGVLLSLAIGISSFPLIRFLSKSFPPAAVLLAKSGKPAIDLQQTISRAMKPFDCISLLRLDPSRSEGTPEYPDADWLYFESFRTSDPTAWRAIVSDLLNMVPIVVIDARQVSPSVMEEVGILLDGERPERVLWVTETGGPDAAIEIVAAVVGHKRITEIFPVSAYFDLKSVGPTLFHATRRRGRLPASCRYS